MTTYDAAVQALLHEIDALFATDYPNCHAEYHPGRITLHNSCQVHSRALRMAICTRIAESELTQRTALSLASEWLFHNLAYSLHIKRTSAHDADLDFVQDERFLVRFGTNCLTFLHIY